MTQQSSAELDPTQPVIPDVPLSERPLVAEDQNTVISTGNDTQNDPDPNTSLSANAQEIRDRLFAPPDSEQNPERGLRIGHFEVEERIGSGGMGAVFRAMDTELSRHVALKVLHPSIAADPSLVARFRNEARACAQLNHDNLARVFFSGEQDGVHYIAYEFADGLTIKELISQHDRISTEDTVNYAIQATLALGHVDAAGIVHRDIKPSNIILTRQGRVKVVDLGLARRDTNDSVGDLTVAGTTLGTFDYISPEQARDPRTADIRSDIYSLGCTIYHMLTGQPPYPEGTALQKLLDHQGKAPPDPRSIAPDVPAELSVIVQAMMNTDPDKRYQEPGQLLADLLTLATKLGLRSVPAEGIVWRRIAVTRVRELSGSLFLTGAVLALCVTALIIHFAPGRGGTDESDVRAVLEAMMPQNADLRHSDAPIASSADNTQSTGNTENGGTEIEPPVTPDVPTTADADEWPFTVVRTNQKQEHFKTLNEAWEAVGSGDEIILNFDGPLDAPMVALDRPRSGSVQRIAMRSAKGLRPLLEFSIDESEVGQKPVFYLSNDLSMSLTGIDIRVNIPPELTEEWTLFEFIGTNQLRLRDCSIDIVNPARVSAGIVRLKNASTELISDVETSIRFENTAVRGASDLVVIQAQVAGSLTVHDCAFALDGTLLNNRGTSLSSASSSLGPGHLTIDYSHNTAMLAQPAIQMTDSDGLTGDDPERVLPTITIDARSNVFASLLADGTLLRSSGNAFATDMRDLVTWLGSNNLYYQFGVYWDVTSGKLGRAPDRLDFSQWVQVWQDSIAGNEDNAAECESAPWTIVEALADLTRSELSNVSTTDLEVNPSLFFGGDGTAALYPTDRNGQMPGVNILDVPAFPKREVADVSEDDAVVPAPAEDDE